MVDDVILFRIYECMFVESVCVELDVTWLIKGKRGQGDQVLYGSNVSSDALSSKRYLVYPI